MPIDKSRMIVQIVGADKFGKSIHLQLLIQKEIAAFVEQPKLSIEDHIICRDGDQDLDLLINVCNEFVESDVFADHTCRVTQSDPLITYLEIGNALVDDVVTKRRRR